MAFVYKSRHPFISSCFDAATNICFKALVPKNMRKKEREKNWEQLIQELLLLILVQYYSSEKPYTGVESSSGRLK